MHTAISLTVSQGNGPEASSDGSSVVNRPDQDNQPAVRG